MSSRISKNISVLFVSSGNAKNGISPIVKNQGDSLYDKNIEINYFPIIGKGLKNYFLHIFRLKKHLKENNYDIIHAHYGLCGIVAQLARDREKLIVSFMGDDLIGALNKKGTYSYWGNILVLLNKIFLKKFDHIIVKSDELSEKIKFNKQLVIPNGVNLNIFIEVSKKEAREKLKIKEDKRIILFVSNPEREEKNYKLSKNASDFIINQNIELITVHSIEQEKLNLYYNAADLIILTSYHEGSPNVIKEAMACNCPIVATDVGDVDWVIGNTEGCFLTSFDVKKTSEKIEAALEFAAKTGRTKGRDRIIELGLDSETIAKRIIKLYGEVLSQ